MMKKAGNVGWLVTGAMAAAFLWAMPAGATDSRVRVEASSLFVNPQEAWARDIEFSDVLESLPTGRPRRLDHRNYIPMRLKEAGTVWVSQDRVKRLPDLVQGDTYLFQGTVDQFDHNYHVIVSDCVSESMPEPEPAAETPSVPETEQASAEEKAAISETLLQVLLLDAQSSLDQLAQANHITVPELIAAQTDGGQSIAENIVADSMKGKDVGDNKTAQELMINAVLSLLQMQSTLKTAPQDADEIVDPPLEVATNAAGETEETVTVAVEGPMPPPAEEMETAAAVAEDTDGPIIGNTPEAAALGATPEGPVESEELAADFASAGEVLPLTDWTGAEGQVQETLPAETGVPEVVTGEMAGELSAAEAVSEGPEGTEMAELAPAPVAGELQEATGETAGEPAPPLEAAAAVDLPGEETLPMDAPPAEQAEETALLPEGDSALAGGPDAVATPEIPATEEVAPEASLPTATPDRLTAAEERKAAALARAEQRRAERQAELDAAAQKKAEEEAAREELARQKAEEKQALAEAKRIAAEEKKAAEEARKAELANQRLMAKKAKEEAAALRAAEERAKEEAARAEEEAKREQEEKARLLALQEKVEAEAALQAEQQKREEEARLQSEAEEQIRRQEEAAAQAAAEEEARLAAEKEQQARQEAEAEAARLAEEAALQKAAEEAAAQVESSPEAAADIPAEDSAASDLLRIQEEEAARIAAESARQQEEMAAESQRQAEALLIAQGVSDQARRDAEANAARIAEEEAARKAAEERIQQMEREIKEMEAQTRQIEEERRQAELRRIQEEAAAKAAAEAEERQARLIEERERQAESIRVAQEVAVQARIDAEAAAVRIAEEEAARKAAEERTRQMEREIQEMEAQSRKIELVPLVAPVVAEPAPSRTVEVQPLPEAEETKAPPVDSGDLPEWMQPVLF